MATETKTVKVTLDNEIHINGVSYPVGTHEVSEDLADDLNRYDKAHDKYLVGLNKNSAVSGSLGSVSAS